MEVSDGVMLDVKADNEERHQWLTGHSIDIVLENLQWLASADKLEEIRTVCIPGSLENEKTEEVNRILRELTYVVSRYSGSYILNFESLMKLDVIFAKAEFGFYHAGIIADINDDKSLYLKDVVHPLIDPKIVVSNTYTLHDPYLGIVISGTNTGGKTVGLKLIGLSIAAPENCTFCIVRRLVRIHCSKSRLRNRRHQQNGYQKENRYLFHTHSNFSFSFYDVTISQHSI